MDSIMFVTKTILSPCHDALQAGHVQGPTASANSEDKSLKIARTALGFPALF